MYATSVARGGSTSRSSRMASRADEAERRREGLVERRDGPGVVVQEQR